MAKENDKLLDNSSLKKVLFYGKKILSKFNDDLIDTTLLI